jgi:hypothetical protein
MDGQRPVAKYPPDATLTIQAGFDQVPAGQFVRRVVNAEPSKELRQKAERLEVVYTPQVSSAGVAGADAPSHPHSKHTFAKVRGVVSSVGLMYLNPLGQAALVPLLQCTPDAPSS